MSDAADPQDEAEDLDRDKLEDRDDCGEDGPVEFPPERPQGMGSDAEVEPYVPESVAAGDAREEPDPLVAALEREAADRVGPPPRTEVEQLLDDLDVEVPDAEFDERLAQASTRSPRPPSGDDDDGGGRYDDEEEVGRTAAPLIDPTPGFDDEPQAVALEGDDTGDESAEEAAMHIEAEPE